MMTYLQTLATALLLVTNPATAAGLNSEAEAERVDRCVTNSQQICLEHAVSSYSAQTYEVICGGVHYLVRNESSGSMRDRIGALRINGRVTDQAEISKVLNTVPNNFDMSVRGFRCDLPSKQQALMHVTLADRTKPAPEQDIWFILSKRGQISHFEGRDLPR